MPSFVIRDIPEEKLTGLKKLAEKNHRSLQRQLHWVIDAVLEGRLDSPDEPVSKRVPLKERIHIIDRDGPATLPPITRDEIYGDDGR
ncbi:hypothetical protein [Roseibacillus persicicus]|nr:hypothetical protein [Roseibacillus persicicus]